MFTGDRLLNKITLINNTKQKQNQTTPLSTLSILSIYIKVISMLKFELCLSTHNKNTIQIKAGGNEGYYTLEFLDLYEDEKGWRCSFFRRNGYLERTIAYGTLQEVVNAAEAHYEENARNQPENH